MDRGLFLYYAYDGEEARQSFATAASYDPKLAMAYWGIALGDGPDLNTPLTADRFDDAHRAIARALLLSPASSARDRRFVSIMALRFAGTFADWPSDDAAYRRAMAKFAQTSDDENARLLAAEALLEHGGLTWTHDTLASDESRVAAALVDDVLRDDPTSAMANHLCLHLYDLAPDRAEALPCAQRLDAASFSPEAEHLAHMPAHYWIETGNYVAALASSERAYALLVRLQAMPDGEEHARHYLKHDVTVGYSAAMMLSDYGAATIWAQRMTTAYGISFDALTALRFGHDADAYAAADPQYGNPAVQGWAALMLGRGGEAQATASALEKSRATLGYLTPLFLARVDEADNDFAQARQWIARASREQSDDFSGELIPFIPAGDALGDLELRAGDRAAAVSAFTQTLSTYPNDPHALGGLAAARGSAGAASAGADFP